MPTKSFCSLPQHTARFMKRTTLQAAKKLTAPKARLVPIKQVHADLFESLLDLTSLRTDSLVRLR